MKHRFVAILCLPLLSGCASLVYSAAEHNARQECRDIPNSSDRIECERQLDERELKARQAEHQDD